MTERLYEVTLHHEKMMGESVAYFVIASNAGQAETGAKTLAKHDYHKDDEPDLFFAHSVAVMTSDLRGLP